MANISFIDKRAGHGMFEDDAPSSRPHIVFITIDMVPPDFHRAGEVNSGLAHTPNIDRLRAESVTFSNAFANSPLCGPSRASYLTGRYPYLTVNEERAHDGWAVALRPDDIIFPEYLKAVGYVTKHAGKSHVGAQKFMDAFGEADTPWNRWAPPLMDDDGYVAYLRRLGIVAPVWKNPIRGCALDRKTPDANYGGFVTQADGRPFPEEATYSHYLAALASEKLDAAFAQGVEKGAPLYLQVDFFAPHQPFMIPAGFEKRAEELRKRAKLPQDFLDAKAHDFKRLDGEPRIYEFYRREIGIYDEDTMREYIVCNALEMESLDGAIGKVIASLKARGVWDSALVIFAADHGEMNGQKALVDKGAYCHPRVARVPLLVKSPKGTKTAGAVVDTPVCLLDIAPTVFEAAGVKPLARLDGLSLLPLINGHAGSEYGGERMFIMESCWHVAPNPAVAFQWRKSPDEHYFYTYNLTLEADELYNLADASYANLARDPRLSRVKREMLHRLAAFLKGDPRWRCYWHTMRIDKQEELPTDGGDYSMFRPE